MLKEQLYMGGGMTSQMMLMAMLNRDITFNQIVSMIFMNQFIVFFPAIIAFFKQFGSLYMKKIKDKIMNNKKIEHMMKDKKLTLKSKIVYTKNKSSTIIQAINNHITNLNESKCLSYYDEYYVTNKEDFEIAPDIYCNVEVIEEHPMNEKSEEKGVNYKITIYSYKYELEYLREYVDKLNEKYRHELNNKLGTKKYFFDEISNKVPKGASGEIRYEMMPKNLTFTMTEFNTNKNLSNVFGHHLNIVKDRIRLFEENSSWYSEKGIPHTLGILLHGPPGTGKTSLIKAIAKYSKRHIFNIKLSKYSTKTQLQNLFFNKKVNVVGNNERNHAYEIPLDERIYLIEDIDCLSDIVQERKENQNNLKEKYSSSSDMDQFYNSTGLLGSRDMGLHAGTIEKNHIISDMKNNTKATDFIKDDDDEYSDGLNLSFLLNLLDGILETPGRILIMTTNHPEKLDKALIRPGRIDLNIHVDYCDLDLIQDMFNHFFSTSKKYTFQEVDYVRKITPAEVNKYLLNYYNSADTAYEKIIEYITMEA